MLLRRFLMYIQIIIIVVIIIIIIIINIEILSFIYAPLVYTKCLQQHVYMSVFYFLEPCRCRFYDFRH